jgi:leucyl aminopeptidase
LVTDIAAARKSFAPLDRIADAVYLTRDVVSEPPNVIYPESLAERCKHLTAVGLKVEVLDEKQMAKLGMGALLGVGQGSAKPPRIVVMRWDGAPRAKDKRPIAFCGKGVTFDTGGISIKPAAGMEDMKWDMAGSGTVIGLMQALAARRAKVNAVGVVGLVENMPGGNAQRPSDIVRSMSGRTIEVLNTDAEGRLVLADVCWYTQDRFKPKAMIDLATLTGAVVVALGHEYAGLFANNEELATGCSPRARRPASCCGACRSRKPTTATSIPTPRTSRTSARRVLPARPSVPSSSSASSTTCRGRISTSPASPGARRTTPSRPRAPRRSACACSTAW